MLKKLFGIIFMLSGLFFCVVSIRTAIVVVWEKGFTKEYVDMYVLCAIILCIGIGLIVMAHRLIYGKFLRQKKRSKERLHWNKKNTQGKEKKAHDENTRENNISDDCYDKERENELRAIGILASVVFIISIVIAVALYIKVDLSKGVNSDYESVQAYVKDIDSRIIDKIYRYRAPRIREYTITLKYKNETYKIVTRDDHFASACNFAQDMHCPVDVYMYNGKIYCSNVTKDNAAFEYYMLSLGGAAVLLFASACIWGTYRDVRKKNRIIEERQNKSLL